MANASNVNFNSERTPAQFPEYDTSVPVILKGLKPEFSQTFGDLEKSAQPIKRAQTIEKMLTESTDHGARNKVLAIAAVAFLISLVTATILVGIFCPPVFLSIFGPITLLILITATITKCCEMADVESKLQDGSRFFSHLTSGFGLGMIGLAPFLPIILIYDAFTRKSRVEGAKNFHSLQSQNEIQEISSKKESYQEMFNQLKAFLEEKMEKFKEFEPKRAERETAFGAVPGSSVHIISGFGVEFYQEALTYVNNMLEFLDNLPNQKPKMEEVG